jgi:hypothetical protein
MTLHATVWFGLSLAALLLSLGCLCSQLPSNYLHLELVACYIGQWRRLAHVCHFVQQANSDFSHESRVAKAIKASPSVQALPWLLPAPHLLIPHCLEQGT